MKWDTTLPNGLRPWRINFAAGLILRLSTSLADYKGACLAGVFWGLGHARPVRAPRRLKGPWKRQEAMSGYEPRYITADGGAMQKHGPRGWLKLDRCSVRKAWLGGCRVRGRHAAEPDHTAMASTPRCRSALQKSSLLHQPRIPSPTLCAAAQPQSLSASGNRAGRGKELAVEWAGQGPEPLPAPGPSAHSERTFGASSQFSYPARPLCATRSNLAVAPSPQSLSPAKESKASVPWR